MQKYFDIFARFIPYRLFKKKGIVHIDIHTKKNKNKYFQKYGGGQKVTDYSVTHRCVFYAFPIHIEII